MKTSDFLDNLFLELPRLRDRHKPSTEQYATLKSSVREQVEMLFEKPGEPVNFGPFGSLIFPYHKMGNIDSLNLFDLDEIIIFSFYWANRDRYKKVLDLGANLGLHSIIMSRCGFSVQCFEPDPTHFEILKENIAFNQVSSIQANNAAISNEAGELEFVRVLGNTTSSHLAGAKANPYGELERFPVEVKPFTALLEGVDLVKMDIEGHEKAVLTHTHKEHWLNTDALVEIENADNAETVFSHFKKIGVNLFSQKTNWQRVETADHMPTSYRDGTLFITAKTAVPW